MRHLLVSLAAVAFVATGAFAQTITDVAPASGAIGTVVTITGTGFGTKRPSVFLASTATGTKTYKLAVTSTSDTSIVAKVTKGVVGTFDVNVKVGSATTAAPAAFSLVRPAITPGQTATAGVGTTITLAGAHFGTKGKIVVGAKKAAVTSWTDTAITYTVPATIPNGAVVVDVYDSLGTDAISGYLTVTGSTVPLASNKVTGAIGGKKFKPRIHYIYYTGTDWTVQMKELGKRGRVLALGVNELTTIPGIFHGTETRPATLTLDVRGVTYTGNPGDFTITITHQEQNKFAGVVSGVVTAPDDTKLQIQSVQFIFDTGL